jgi:quinoprotein glucose dehydrogenase
MLAPSKSETSVRLTAALFALLGVYLTAGGAWLLAYRDTPFYLVAGLAMLATGFLLWTGRRAALWVYAALVLVSLVWAIVETGMDFWSMVPRTDVFIVLGLALLAPFIIRSLQAEGMAKWVLAGSLFLAVALLVAAFAQDPSDVAGFLPTDKIVKSAGDVGQAPDADWPAYGRTQFGDRFSPLVQINSGNVKDLKIAWTLRTGDLKGPDDPLETTNEATPLAINGALFLCSTHQKIFAIDGASGKVKWIFDPHIHVNPGFQHLTCRGLTYHASDDAAVTSDGSPAPAGECRHRLFLPTNDGRMFAVDADSGKTCPSFGDHGQLDLRTPGMPYTKVGDYEPTSPPVVTDKLVIISGAVTDNGSIREPSGVTRGFDLFTGKLVWAFDPGNPDPNQLPEDGHKYIANSPNSWITSSYDAKLGQIYIPTGVQTPDEWGGNRNSDSERYASGVLALHADTGKLAWFYQTVHHDL